MNATTTAPITPTTLLRNATENAIATHANPKVGIRQIAQLASTAPSERVRIVFSVPWLSSDEKMSPAATAASSGRIHAAEKASVVIGVAKPVVLRKRP